MCDRSASRPSSPGDQETLLSPHVLVRKAFYVAFAAGIGVLELFSRCVATVLCMFLPAGVLDEMQILFGVISSRLLGARVGGEKKNTCLFNASAHGLCEARGFPLEEHVVVTEDGFILSLQRIPHGRARGADANSDRERPPVYLQHGFLQNSEVWLTPDADRALPFILADAGYDVWLGNARGNKYSSKHVHLKPNDSTYWDWSIDEMVQYDIPAALSHVLKINGAASLVYVGFSQGTALAFATLSTNPAIASKVSLFVALAPAARINGLSNAMIDTLVRCSPGLLFTIMGRRCLLPSTLFWRRVLSRQNFARLIDASMYFLFGWTGRCIRPEDKPLFYSHLYSFSSVKTVVHWFQMIASGRFQFYDDYSSSSVTSGHRYKGAMPPAYPLYLVPCPIALFYGGEDTIPNIDALLKEIPTPVFTHFEPEYEHLDFLWAGTAAERVYSRVLGLLRQRAPAAAAPAAAAAAPPPTTGGAGALALGPAAMAA
eukprot:tig00000219_g19467.t1